MDREQRALKTQIKGEQIKRAFDQLGLDAVSAAIERQLLEEMLQVPSNSPQVIESFRIAITLNRRYIGFLRGAVASGELSTKDLAAIRKAAKVRKGIL